MVYFVILRWVVIEFAILDLNCLNSRDLEFITLARSYCWERLNRKLGGEMVVFCQTCLAWSSGLDSNFMQTTQCCHFQPFYKYISLFWRPAWRQNTLFVLLVPTYTHMATISLSDVKVKIAGNKLSPRTGSSKGICQ